MHNLVSKLNFPTPQNDSADAPRRPNVIQQKLSH